MAFWGPTSTYPWSVYIWRALEVVEFSAPSLTRPAPGSEPGWLNSIYELDIANEPVIWTSPVAVGLAAEPDHKPPPGSPDVSCC